MAKLTSPKNVEFTYDTKTKNIKVKGGPHTYASMTEMYEWLKYTMRREERWAKLQETLKNL